MNRKSELSTTWIMMLTIFVLFIILVFGSISFMSLLKFSKSSSQTIFFEQLKRDIEMVSHSKGSKTLAYNIPSDVGQVLIIDKQYEKAVINEPFVHNNVRILDTIESGEKKNMFILTKTGILSQSFYIGDIEIAKLGSYECDGYGIINVTGNSLKLKISNRGFGRIIIGEECTNLLYWALEYPFKQINTEVGSPRLETDYAKSIRLLRSPTVDNGGYHRNGTFVTNSMHINSTNFTLYRLYFDSVTPGDSMIKIQIGYKNSSGEWVYKGKDPDKYYTTNGLAIDYPGFEFNDTSVRVTLESTSDQKQTPVLNWIRIAYKDKYRVEVEEPEYLITEPPDAP